MSHPIQRRAFVKQLGAAGAGLLGACGQAPVSEIAPPFDVEITPITSGPLNHFFGYIGHVQNTPWSGDDRFALALRVGFQDHMPEVHEPADVILIDMENGYQIRKLDECRAWNPQQGTMFYWNPDKQSSQFFFNDRDPDTNKVFCVLYDVEQGRRIREYRDEERPIGNSGVAQNGGSFLGLNYGRLAHLRRVTGYVGAHDFSEGVLHPDDDGIFKTDIESGKQDLVVSYKQIADVLAESQPHIEQVPLFINHTLWNRDDDRIYFFARGGWSGGGPREERINSPMTVRPDGTGLTQQSIFIGGHPEWEFGPNLMGRVADDLVLYDSDKQEIVEEIGSPEVFPDPEGDTSLSPDGNWIVNGWKEGGGNQYVLYRRSDGAWIHTEIVDQNGYTSGDLRNDPAPTWNRASNQVLFPSVSSDEGRSRQMYLMRINV